MNLEQRPQHRRREVHVPGFDFFYLSALLDRYKYMKIPLELFPDWIKKQYNLDLLGLDGFVFLEMRSPFGDSPRPEFWQTSYYAKDFSHTDTMNVQIPQACENIPHTQSHSLWLLTTLG
jgi:hypothetical protein